MLILALFLVATGQPSAAAPAQSPPADAKPVEPVKERMVCRKEVDTGTRINRRRICAPARVWDEVRQEHLDSTAHRKADAERGRQCTGFPCRP